MVDMQIDNMLFQYNFITDQWSSTQANSKADIMKTIIEIEFSRSIPAQERGFAYDPMPLVTRLKRLAEKLGGTINVSSLIQYYEKQYRSGVVY